MRTDSFVFQLLEFLFWAAKGYGGLCDFDAKLMFLFFGVALVQDGRKFEFRVKGGDFSSAHWKDNGLF